jgi:hypothetical protein
MVILDNGRGMTEDELLDAMRHGTGNPRQHRSPKDLGRFGLGLKTASFSQCRSLTVVSTRDGTVCGAEWNLDRIDAADDWILSIRTMRTSMGCLMSNGSAPGTAVIWRELDRLMEDEAGDRRDEIVNEKLEVVGRHLSLVFHRFLSGEIKGHARISLTVNGRPITAFDPFCRKNPATQVLPEEIVRIGEAGCACSLTCFHTTVVCPRPSTTTTRIAVTSSPTRGLRLSKRPPDGLGRLVQTGAEG